MNPHYYSQCQTYRARCQVLLGPPSPATNPPLTQLCSMSSVRAPILQIKPHAQGQVLYILCHSRTCHTQHPCIHSHKSKVRFWYYLFTYNYIYMHGQVLLCNSSQQQNARFIHTNTQPHVCTHVNQQAIMHSGLQEPSPCFEVPIDFSQPCGCSLVLRSRVPGRTRPLALGVQHCSERVDPLRADS